MKHNLNHTALLLLTLVLAVACAPVEVRNLDKMKTAYSDGDYTAVVGSTIDCTGTDAECAQQHLLKGHACLRLAFPAGESLNGCSDAEQAKLDCAQHELTSAIGSITDWSGGVNLHEAATNHGLLVTLYCQRERSSGTEGVAFNQQLQSTAERYLASHNDDVVARYFRLSAHLTALRPQLITGDAGATCTELGALAVEAAAGAARAESAGYAQHYAEIGRQIDGFKSLVNGCTE